MDELLRAVRDFHSRYHDNAIEVYYPQTEEDWLLMGLGAPVEFEGIVERWACPTASFPMEKSSITPCGESAGRN